MAETRCPNCDAIIKVDNPKEDTRVLCPECFVELDVISVNPFEVDFTDDWQDE